MHSIADRAVLFLFGLRGTAFSAARRVDTAVLAVGAVLELVRLARLALTNRHRSPFHGSSRNSYFVCKGNVAARAPVSFLK